MDTLSDKQTNQAIESCACFHFRKTARSLTALYDKALSPAGLRSGQFVLLLAIHKLRESTRNALAEAVGLDQSALSRGLQAIERQKWIKTSTGKDRRTRLVTLTPKGHQKLREAYPLWEDAQKQVKNALGARHLKDLLDEVSQTHEKLQPALEPAV